MSGAGAWLKAGVAERTKGAVWTLRVPSAGWSMGA